MRLGSIGRLILVVVVVSSATWVTSRLVGQTRYSKQRVGADKGAAGRVAADAKRPSVIKTTVVKRKRALGVDALAEAAAVRDLPAGAIPVTPKSSVGAVGSLKANVVDGQVEVALASEALETDPRVYFLWSLRVFADGPGRKLLSEHYYKDQTFKVQLGERTEQTFHESFALAPGAYRVQVNLHRIREGFDLAKLVQKDVWQRSTAISISEKVVVP
jgi:hypothetical protein